MNERFRRGQLRADAVTDELRSHAPVIDARQLTCERDSRVLFKGLDVVVEPGGCLEVTGPNGSGKSTLLRALAGLFRPEGGRHDLGIEDCLYMGHRAGISDRLSPMENLAWIVGLERPVAEPEIAAALDETGIGAYADEPCAHLSAGQKRRVGLARLLLSHAVVWLLDEPFTALDAQGVALVQAIIRRHRESGGAVVCATHQPLGLAGSAELSLG